MEKHVAPIVVYAEVEHYPCETCGSNTSEIITLAKLCEKGDDEEISRAWRNDHFGNTSPATISYADFDEPAILAAHLLAPLGIEVDAGKRHFVMKRGEMSARYRVVDGAPLVKGKPAWGVEGLADLIADAMPHFGICAIRRPQKARTRR